VSSSVSHWSWNKPCVWDTLVSTTA